MRRNNKIYKNNKMVIGSLVPREGYVHPQKFHKQYSKSEFWTSQLFLMIANCILAGTDALVLYSVLERAMANTIPFLSVISSIVFAFILNFLPLITGKAICQLAYYKKDKVINIVNIILTAFVFSLFYGASVYLRFAYGDENGLAVENLSGGSDLAINTLTQSQIDARNLILALEPFVTSIINLVLAIIITPFEKGLRSLHGRKLQLNEEKDALLSKLNDIENYHYEDILEDDEQAFRTIHHQIAAIAKNQQSVARNILAEYLADPASISAITDCEDNEIIDPIAQDAIYA